MKEMLNKSVLDVYNDVSLVIQEKLKEQNSIARVTQSLIEIWKFAYIRYPNVIKVSVPDYPDYYRDLANLLIEVDNSYNAELVDEIDREYFRVIDVFGRKGKHMGRIMIDLSFYDVNKDMPYWPNLDGQQVIKEVYSME